MDSAENPIESTPRFAIIGYAARFPAADAEEFWDVLREGRDAISEVPADRWDAEEFFDRNPVLRKSRDPARGLRRRCDGI